MTPEMLTAISIPAGGVIAAWISVAWRKRTPSTGWKTLTDAIEKERSYAVKRADKLQEDHRREIENMEQRHDAEMTKVKRALAECEAKLQKVYEELYYLRRNGSADP